MASDDQQIWFNLGLLAIDMGIGSRAFSGHDFLGVLEFGIPFRARVFFRNQSVDWELV